MRFNRTDAVIPLLQVLILAVNFDESVSIKCYRCTAVAVSAYSANGTTTKQRLCSNFDNSERYVVDCPYSTFCMKKTFTVPLGGDINGTARDCAAQREFSQEFKDGQWREKTSIEEVYTEGCFVGDDKGARLSRTVYCYCKGDYCNGAPSYRIATTALISATISVILVYFLRAI